MFRALVGLALVFAGAAGAVDLKIIVPAAPGGGWDQLGRGVQQTMQAAKIADRVQVSNAAGAGGTIGLAQLINNNKGDGSALMVSGKGMVSAVYINKSPVSLSNVTPIARLDRRVRGAGGAGVVESEDDGRPRGHVQGQSRLGLVGRRSCRRRRSAHRRHDRAGDRRREREVQLRRVRQRRRGAGANARRPRHGRHGRLQRVRRADQLGQAARARDHLRQAACRA